MKQMEADRLCDPQVANCSTQPRCVKVQKGGGVAVASERRGEHTGKAGMDPGGAY